MKSRDTELATQAVPSANQVAGFARLGPLVKWLVLLAISTVITIILEYARLPAALMLGPMIAAIFLATNGASLKVARWPVNFAQAVIGCLIARSLTPGVFVSFADHWLLFLSIVLAITLAGIVLGWLIGELGIMQGTTAIWGLQPGGATVMVLMAEAFGADARLVAFMQYSRVVLVALTASLIARFWIHIPADAAQIIWFPPIDPLSLGFAAAIIAISLLAAFVPRIPARVLIAAIFFGGMVQLSGIGTIQLPPWLLAVAFALIGWHVGSRFTAELLRSVVRVLPKSFLAIAAMMVLCGGVAFLLVHLLAVDPLTAYLATSPGGVDAVAIIAASTKVDVPFVMGLQTIRLLFVLSAGPFLSRFVARLMQSRADLRTNTSH